MLLRRVVRIQVQLLSPTPRRLTCEDSFGFISQWHLTVDFGRLSVCSIVRVSAGGKNPFGQGKTSNFDIEWPDLGEIRKLRVGAPSAT